MLNLTPYLTTVQQHKAGVVDLPKFGLEKKAKLLKFDALPTVKELVLRSESLASLAAGYTTSNILIAGPEFITRHLIIALLAHNLTPYFAFGLMEGGQLVHKGFILA